MISNATKDVGVVQNHFMEAAEQYVRAVTRDNPEIIAVYATGSVVRGEAVYPWGDLDLRVVLPGDNPGRTPEELTINGITVEVGFRGASEFESIEAVLGMWFIGPS